MCVRFMVRVRVSSSVRLELDLDADAAALPGAPFPVLFLRHSPTGPGNEVGVGVRCCRVVGV